MKCIPHPSCNSSLASPRGSPHIPGIKTKQYDFEGIPVVVSFWKPDAEELAALNAGAYVAIHFLGGMHPPTSVRVEE